MGRSPRRDEEVLAQIPAAGVRARVADTAEPRANSTYYDAEARRIVVELKNGCAFAFPPQLEASLRGATPEQLAAVEVGSGGEALHWKALDAEIALSGFLAHLLNVRSWAASYMGRIRSPAKTAAARINAKKGGRPRKKDPVSKSE